MNIFAEIFFETRQVGQNCSKNIVQGRKKYQLLLEKVISHLGKVNEEIGGSYIFVVLRYWALIL